MGFQLKKGAGDGIVSRHRGGADAHDAAVVLQALDVLAEVFVDPHELHGIFLHDLARLGQLDPAVAALEKLEAHLVLEALHLLAERGLRNVVLGSHAGDALLVGDLAE